MTNVTSSKPAKNHPWRNSASSDVVKWSRKESAIRNTSNVFTARPSTLSIRDKRIIGGK